jgi:hypothetical protein
MKWRRLQQSLVLDLDNGYRLVAQPRSASCTVSLWDPEKRLLACCQLPKTAEELEAASPTRVLAACLEFVLRGEYGTVPQYGEFALKARKGWGREACEALRAA